MNRQPLDSDSDGMDTTPAWYIWPAIADIMVCLLGIFVLLFVWSTVLQIEIEAKLKSEQEARQAEAKRLVWTWDTCSGTWVTPWIDCMQTNHQESLHALDRGVDHVVTSRIRSVGRARGSECSRALPAF